MVRLNPTNWYPNLLSLRHRTQYHQNRVQSHCSTSILSRFVFHSVGNFATPEERPLVQYQQYMGQQNQTLTRAQAAYNDYCQDYYRQYVPSVLCCFSDSNTFLQLRHLQILWPVLWLQSCRASHPSTSATTAVCRVLWSECSEEGRFVQGSWDGTAKSEKGWKPSSCGRTWWNGRLDSLQNMWPQIWESESKPTFAGCLSLYFLSWLCVCHIFLWRVTKLAKMAELQPTFFLCQIACHGT